MLTKEKVEELMKIKGESRGMNVKVDLDFIFENKGEQGIKKVEDRVKELGFPLNYKKIKSMDFYPIGLDVIVLLAIKDVFNFTDEEVKKMGYSVVKFSMLMKIFMKYFGSLKLIANQIPKIWKEHYSIGSLEMPKFSEKERYVILKLKDFQIHPIFCKVYQGYFVKVSEMVLKASVSCKETKCMFKGDEYHEFLLTW